jgi:hypothetical protein
MELAAIPGGAFFGALGAAWSAGRARVQITALMSASFAGEAVIFHQLADPAAVPYLIAAAGALPMLLVSRTEDRLRAVALALPLVLAAVLAEGSVFLATGYLIRA